MPLPHGSYQPDDAARHFRARWDAEIESQRLARQRMDEQERKATSLLLAGATLIPSEHLRDNEFVVSRGIYEAAKRIAAR